VKNIPNARYIFVVILIVGIVGFWSIQTLIPQPDNEFTDYVRGLPDGNTRHWALVVGVSHEN
jgi:hypothetical protein